MLYNVVFISIVEQSESAICIYIYVHIPSFFGGGVVTYPDLPGGSEGKESACNAGDPGSILGLGRSPGRGHGNPLQCSCLENFMDRGAWWATFHEITKS